MKITIWVAQVLLALAFGIAGAIKGFTPLDQLAANMPWVADAPAWVPRLAGISELAAAFGLILPAATRIKPWLTPLAALGLIVVMALASLFHLSRGEFGALAPNFVLASMAAFVWWGRTKRAPIEGRGMTEEPAIVPVGTR